MGRTLHQPLLTEDCASLCAGVCCGPKKQRKRQRTERRSLLHTVPDYRIEYEVDGREHHQDVELFTEHYRGAHAASHAQTGFRIYVVGSRGGGGRSGPHPRGMEEFL